MELVKNLLDYLLLTLIFVSTNSIYVNSGNKFTPFTIVIAGMLIVINLFTTKITISYLKKIAFIVGAYYLVIIMLMLVHSEIYRIFSYLVLFPIIIVCVLIESYRNSLEKFLDKFVQVILVLVIISLFFWFFGSILKIISPTNYVLNGWINGRETPSYFNLYFETQDVKFLGIHFIRNSGIYAEGPMWNLMLSLALMIQVLLLPKNHKRELILIFTIFTVASTTGIFIVGVLYIYKILHHFNRRQKVIAFSATPFILFGLVRIFKSKANSISASIRLDDFVAGISAWRESILFGSGLSNGLKVLESYMNTSIRPNLGNSDSFVLILAQGGILLGILYFYPMVKIIISKKFTLKLKIFTILYFIILITSIFVQSALFALMIGIFYGLILESNSLKSENEIFLYKEVLAKKYQDYFLKIKNHFSS